MKEAFYVIKIAEDAFRINFFPNKGVSGFISFLDWGLHKLEVSSILSTCLVLSIGLGPCFAGRYLMKVIIIINYFLNFYLIVIRNGSIYLNYMD